MKNKIRSVSKSKVNAELVRIHWNIVGRIVTLLYRQSRLKKSEIAAKARLGYDKCKRYLQWMEMMDLVSKEINEDDYEVMLLTDKATILYDKQFKDMHI